MIGMDEREKEKFERFVSFCLEQTNIYLVMAGDQETFFSWYGPFEKITLSSLLEIRPMRTSHDLKPRDGEEILFDSNGFRKPIEYELLNPTLTSKTC